VGRLGREWGACGGTSSGERRRRKEKEGKKRKKKKERREKKKEEEEKRRIPPQLSNLRTYCTGAFPIYVYLSCDSGPFHIIDSASAKEKREKNNKNN